MDQQPVHYIKVYNLNKFYFVNNLFTILYVSVSQPFGLQVPVKPKFSSYCPGPKKVAQVLS